MLQGNLYIRVTRCITRGKPFVRTPLSPLDGLLLTTQKFNKCHLECAFEQCIDDWVQRARNPAEPHESRHENFIQVTRRADGTYYVDTEEWRPAQDEDEKYYSENFGGLLLRLDGGAVTISVSCQIEHAESFHYNLFCNRLRHSSCRACIAHGYHRRARI